MKYFVLRSIPFRSTSDVESESKSIAIFRILYHIWSCIMLVLLKSELVLVIFG